MPEFRKPNGAGGRQYFTPQARAAAAAARRKRATIKALTKNQHEVFAIRAADQPGRYQWQIRHFGGVILETSLDSFRSALDARTAGLAALIGDAGPGNALRRLDASDDRETSTADIKPLLGLRILVVEDDYMQADDIKGILYCSGAAIVKLTGRLTAALEQIEMGFDVVLLDINLHGEMSFCVADRLDRLQLPFAFITGYDRMYVPERFAQRMHLDKPFDPKRLADNVRHLCRGGANH